VVDAEAGKGFSRDTVKLSPVDKDAGAARISAAEEDVLGDRKGGDDVELLVDEAEAEAMRSLRALDDDGVSVDTDVR
jgi:hypothetical protein